MTRPNAGRPDDVDFGDGWAARLAAAQRDRDELRRAVADIRSLLNHYPERQALGSREFSRGYALACRDLTAVLDQLLLEHP